MHRASTENRLLTFLLRTSISGKLDFWGSTIDSRRCVHDARREAPITFFNEIEFEGFEAGPGHWALTRFEDVHFASRHPEIFSSYPNITIADQQPEVAEYFGSMIALDDPATPGYEVSSAVRSPRVVARTEIRCAPEPASWWTI